MTEALMKPFRLKTRTGRPWPAEQYAQIENDCQFRSGRMPRPQPCGGRGAWLRPRRLAPSHQVGVTPGSLTDEITAVALEQSRGRHAPGPVQSPRRSATADAACRRQPTFAFAACQLADRRW